MLQVLLDRQKFVLYNPNTTTAEEAHDEYKTDIQKWFARPQEYENIHFRADYEDYTISSRCPTRIR
jgi:hypothetical protein